jgi:hypothetical protein
MHMLVVGFERAICFQVVAYSKLVALWFAATFQTICKTVIQVKFKTQYSFINIRTTKLRGRLFSKYLRMGIKTNII